MDEKKERARSAELADTYAAPVHMKVRVNSNDDRALPPTWMVEEIRVEELQVWMYGPLLKIMHEIGDVAETADSIILLASEHADELIRAVAIATCMSADHASRIAGSDFIKLAFAVYDVNRDFFIRNLGNRVDAVTAMVTRLMGQVKTAQSLNGDGSTLSPSLESMAASSTLKN